MTHRTNSTSAGRNALTHGRFSGSVGALQGPEGGQYPAIMKEAEGQYRFPIKIVPNAERADGFFDARLITTGPNPVFYLLRPGTNTYLEEWILHKQ